jgi:hypothetical protein
MPKDNTYSIIQDIRFWIVLASFVLLIWIAMGNYPA